MTEFIVIVMAVSVAGLFLAMALSRAAARDRRHAAGSGDSTFMPCADGGSSDCGSSDGGCGDGGGGGGD